MTRLEELPLPHDFTLLVDAGCFHTLPLDRRDAYVAAVTSVAAPSATLLIFGFARRAFAPLKAGVTADEVGERFVDWELVEAGRVAPEMLREHLNENRLVARAASRFDPWQYRLQRRPH